MLQNARVTVFTVSEVLRENQQGVKLRSRVDQGETRKAIGFESLQLNCSDITQVL